MAQQAIQSPIFLERLHDLIKRSGRSRSSIYSDIQAGTMVPPIKIGLRSSAWLQSETDAVLSARISGKTPEEIKCLVRELIAARKAHN